MKKKKNKKKMNKQLVLPAYIIVEIIYYFVYRASMQGAHGDEALKTFLPIYIIFVLVNTYLLYVISPDNFKSKYFKSKNIGLRILFYIGLVLISGLITNAPVELLIEGSI